MDPDSLTNDVIRGMDAATLHSTMAALRDYASAQAQAAQQAEQARLQAEHNAEQAQCTARTAQAAAPPAPVIHVAPAPVTVHTRPSTPKPPKPKFYDGTRSLPKLNEWTKQIERYCSLFPAMDGAERVRHAAMYLEKDASTWWDYWCAQVARGTLRLPPDLPAFFKILIEAFAPKNYQRKIEDQFHYLQQKTSVRNYIHEFRNLLTQHSEPPTQENILKQFIRGLKEDVKADVIVRQPRTLEEAENFAQVFDDAHFWKKPGFPPPRPGNGQHRNAHHNPSTWTGVALMEIDSNAVQASPSVRPSNPLPKLTDTERAQLRASGKCFRCRQPGHTKATCPQNVQGNGQGNGHRHQASRQTVKLNVVEAATSTDELGNAQRL
jgi:hypothetical protein